MANKHQNPAAWLHISRLVAVAFLSAGVFTFSGLAVLELFHWTSVQYVAPGESVSSRAALSMTELPASPTDGRQEQSVRTPPATSLRETQKIATNAALRKTGEELQRTRDKNRRLEALVEVLRQRGTKKSKSVNEMTRDIDIGLVAEGKR